MYKLSKMHLPALLPSLTSIHLLLLSISPYTSQAHITLKSPAPFGSIYNPYSPTTDWSLTNPLPNASSFPCKNYHTSPSHGANHPVASWPAGSTQNFTLDGSAWHSGGSCQVSLSYDNGKSWKVMKSFIGGCPSGPPNESADHAIGSFTVPPEAESGGALFAWTWFNRIGNREMYMSCAAVTITKPETNPNSRPTLQLEMQSSGWALWSKIIAPWNVRRGGQVDVCESQRGESSGYGYRGGLDGFPDILVAQLDGLNDCYIPEGEQVEFPHPGRDVQRGAGRTTLPRGNCEYPL